MVKPWKVGRLRWLAILLCLGASTVALAAETAATYKHFAWRKVADGVWFGTALPNAFQTGNTVIMALPSGGSLVVDSELSSSLGRQIIEEAKAVAPGPVRYLVNTHLHQDHVGGNAAFKEEFPNVQIIAHRNACLGITQKTIPRMEERIEPMTKQLAAMQAKRAGLADGDEQAAALDHRIAGTQLYLQDAKNFKWAMPTTCLDLKPGESSVITDGARRIEIYYFGRAHSNGDLVVFLPKEKVLAIGDLWAEKTGQMLLDAGLDGRDGSVLDGPETLKRIRALGFDISLPGHTGVMHGKAALDAAIADGEKMITQVHDRWARGDDIEDVLRKMPPPPDASPFIADRWRRVVTSAFEEMDQRWQLGMRQPGQQ